MPHFHRAKFGALRSNVLEAPLDRALRDHNARLEPMLAIEFPDSVHRRAQIELGSRRTRNASALLKAR